MPILAPGSSDPLTNSIMNLPVDRRSAVTKGHPARHLLSNVNRTSSSVIAGFVQVSALLISSLTGSTSDLGNLGAKWLSMNNENEGEEYVPRPAAQRIAEKSFVSRNGNLVWTSFVYVSTEVIAITIGCEENVVLHSGVNGLDKIGVERNQRRAGLQSRGAEILKPVLRRLDCRQSYLASSALR